MQVQGTLLRVRCCVTTHSRLETVFYRVNLVFQFVPKHILGLCNLIIKADDLAVHSLGTAFSSGSKRSLTVYYVRNADGHLVW